jgi:hypothetical protein
MSVDLAKFIPSKVLVHRFGDGVEVIPAVGNGKGVPIVVGGTGKVVFNKPIDRDYVNLLKKGVACVKANFIDSSFADGWEIKLEDDVRYFRELIDSHYADLWKVEASKNTKLTDYNFAGTGKIKSEDDERYFRELIDSHYTDLWKVEASKNAKFIDSHYADFWKVEASKNAKFIDSYYADFWKVEASEIAQLIGSLYADLWKVEASENTKRIDFGFAGACVIKTSEEFELIDWHDANLGKVEASKNAKFIDSHYADGWEIKTSYTHALEYVVKHLTKYISFLALVPEDPFVEGNLKAPKHQVLIWYIPSGASGSGSADQQFNTKEVELTSKAETHIDWLPVLPQVPVF